jgi:hypothetical protein
MNLKLLEVRGPRKDLTRTRDPERIGVLGLAGSIQSLAGVERMVNLQAVDISISGPLELDRFEPVFPTLQRLWITTKADVDFRVIERFVALRQLGIWASAEASGESLAAIRFARFEHLTTLILEVGEQWALPIDTSWVNQSRVSELRLWGFAFTSENVDDLSVFRNQPLLSWGPRTEELDALFHAKTGSEPPLRVPSVIGQILDFPDQRPRYSLALQYADAWDLENEYEASDHLQDLVQRADTALAARLAWDPTADEIWVRADSRADLESVARIAGQADSCQ